MTTYRELLNLTRIVAIYETKAEAMEAARLIPHSAVFYSDGSERPVGWEVWT